MPLSTELLESSALVAALIGACSALVGALIGSLGSWLIQRSQQKHSSEEAKVQRLFELRRQIYLDAVEAFVAMCGALPNADTPIAVQEAFKPMLEKMAKAHLVVSDNAHVSNTDLAKAVQPYLNGVMLRVAKLQPIREQTESLQGKQTELLEEQREIAKQFMLTDSEQEKEVLASRFRKTEEIIAENQANLVEQFAKLNEALRTHQVAVVEGLEPLREAFVELQIAFRSEIGVETDIEQFRRLTEETARKAVSEFHKAMPPTQQEIDSR